MAALSDRIQDWVGYRLLRVPDPVVRYTTGRAPVSVGGQRLDDRTQHALWVLAAARRPPLFELSAPAARREYRRMPRLFEGPPVPMAEVIERSFQSDGRTLRARIYRPRQSSRPMAALVFLHGGGGVIGDLDTHDGACRLIASVSDCVVVSAEYGLGPEEPFPAAPNDSLAAFRWVHGQADALQIDRSSIAIGGDSMGGCLAAVVCQMARDDGGPQPCAQLLLYPATDRSTGHASQKLFADGFLLTAPIMKWFFVNYVGEADSADPRVSPLLAEDLRGLPPAVVITAGFDPLRDEGQAYARALSQAGVHVQERCYDSLIHGFAQLTGVVPTAMRALRESAQALRAILDARS